MAGRAGAELPSLTAFWVGLLYDEDARLTPAGAWSRPGPPGNARNCAIDCAALVQAEIRGRNMLTLAQETCALRPRGRRAANISTRNGATRRGYPASA